MVMKSSSPRSVAAVWKSKILQTLRWAIRHASLADFAYDAEAVFEQFSWFESGIEEFKGAERLHQESAHALFPLDVVVGRFEQLRVAGAFVSKKVADFCTHLRLSK